MRRQWLVTILSVDQSARKSYPVLAETADEARRIIVDARLWKVGMWTVESTVLDDLGPDHL